MADTKKTFDLTGGMSNADIMKKIIKDATKGMKGEAKEKYIREMFSEKVSPKKVPNKAIKTVKPKMLANKGGYAMKKKK
jgi:hypothetical protein